VKHIFSRGGTVWPYAYTESDSVT